ncbi:hypothetical protein IF1G_06563 [Cordyceps javanica]|uniref:Uncharacterized protein n=1 Tax=Cordyceps javanica TaxID=43265 RepID=A0A545UYK0_9HYPO|nr:hypothetical protein IF1G_06563 [Cordyceps javanica]
MAAMDKERLVGGYEAERRATTALDLRDETWSVETGNIANRQRGSRRAKAKTYLGGRSGARSRYQRAGTTKGGARAA